MRQFVHTIFDEKYHSTIGVLIEKKEIPVGERIVNLMIWDVAGEEEFQEIPTSFIKGAAGCLIVADGTRPETLDTGEIIRERVRETLGDVPQILLVNKCDLEDQWAPPDDLRAFIATSAKNGQGVEDAFSELAERVL